MTPSPLIPGTTQATLRLSVPDDGIRDGDLVLRLPRETDIDVLLPVFADPELREAGNLPDMSRDEALATLPLLPALAESGRMAPLVATLGVLRVEAYVNVGNEASDRVVERAGFTREGVVRSLPRPDGSRVDKTLYSLLPGE